MYSTTARESLSTQFKFLDSMDRTHVSVVQPDVGRVGGLAKTMRVRRLAAQRQLRAVPHLWKTGISIAAATHVAVITPHGPFIEFLPKAPCESAPWYRTPLQEVEMRTSHPPPQAPGPEG